MIRRSRADNLRVAKRLGPGSKMVDFVDASPNIEAGVPVNEWDGWGEAVRKGYDAVERII